MLRFVLRSNPQLGNWPVNPHTLRGGFPIQNVEASGKLSTQRQVLLPTINTRYPPVAICACWFRGDKGLDVTIPGKCMHLANNFCADCGRNCNCIRQLVRRSNFSLLTTAIVVHVAWGLHAAMIDL